jgi:hypothetical protein
MLARGYTQLSAFQLGFKCEGQVLAFPVQKPDRERLASSPEYRLWGAFRTAIPNALFCPISISSCLLRTLSRQSYFRYVSFAL